MNNKFINEKKVDFLPTLTQTLNVKKIQKNKDSIIIIDNLFSNNDIVKLKKIINNYEWVPVGIDGILKNYKSEDPIGSYRLSFYSEELSSCIYNYINEHLENIHIDDFSTIEGGKGDIWTPVSVNPLFRCIKYLKNGLLIPHYDSSYIEKDNKKTIKSFIIYLTNNQSGKTRFLYDAQENIIKEQRNYEDQNRTPSNEEILFSITPKEGKGIIFNHRILHDTEISNEEKIILRTDIVYEKKTI